MGFATKTFANKSTNVMNKLKQISEQGATGDYSPLKENIYKLACVAAVFRWDVKKTFKDKETIKDTVTYVFAVEGHSNVIVKEYTLSAYEKANITKDLSKLNVSFENQLNLVGESIKGYVELVTSKAGNKYNIVSKMMLLDDAEKPYTVTKLELPYWHGENAKDEDIYLAEGVTIGVKKDSPLASERKVVAGDPFDDDEFFDTFKDDEVTLTRMATASVEEMEDIGF
jgi:hypothetical protein